VRNSSRPVRPCPPTSVSVHYSPTTYTHSFVSVRLRPSPSVSVRAHSSCTSCTTPSLRMTTVAGDEELWAPIGVSGLACIWWVDDGEMTTTATKLLSGHPGPDAHVEPTVGFEPTTCGLQGRSLACVCVHGSPAHPIIRGGWRTICPLMSVRVRQGSLPARPSDMRSRRTY